MEKISVAICTRNRERLLQGTLESLCHVHPLKQMAWEIVIILNDCSDQSQLVIEQFKTRLPIVSAPEPCAGLSRARNRALEVASGDVMIWIDDDVQVDTGWLRAYEAAFVRWPEASVFGGAIIPEFEGEAPLWLEQAWQLCGSAFAARTPPHPDAPIRLEDHYPPYGANFAVRMPVQRQFRYDVRLGARPGGLIMTGEETAVIRDILRSGGIGYWVDHAVVRHVMPRERQTIEYIRAYYEGCGWMSAQGARHNGARPSALQRIADRCHVIASESRFRCLRVFAHPRRWMPALVDAATVRGRWRGRYSDDHSDAAG
jgi:glycosyltransferase involved in cell wall biosynthesis